MSAALEISRVTVRYGVRRSALEFVRRKAAKHVHAVNDVDLAVERGEMVALVGESGCGKTSLGGAAVGLVTVDSGVITIDGAPITSRRMSPETRRRAQMVFQDPYDALDPRQRVRDALIEPLRIHGLVPKSRAERDALLESSLERVGLSPPGLFLDRHPHELSGGQRQRVSIATALMLAPALLVADEPVSMLDVSIRAGVLALLGRLRDDGMAILMITHDLASAALVADRIVVMYLGAIVEQGPTRALIADPVHPYTRALMANVPRPGRVRSAPVLVGEVADGTELPHGCVFAPRCSAADAACRADRPALVGVGDREGVHSAACIHPREDAV